MTLRNVDCNDSISDCVLLISLLIIDCDLGFFCFKMERYLCLLAMRRSMLGL
ncbi:hypothetical protein [Staphylococcus xylosus]|uniref:hypothetical protein n=1 Tax=Staphylococcus xylosus TaxID=1288 RepID=UPI00298F2858|nr:hypothetical protein [Staphylococcus xylosus]MDW8555544.1 hypothetical protein [Staphylococcus xylosus]